MNSSTISWLYCTFMVSFLLTSFLSSAADISYGDHCNSIVPESTLTRLPDGFLSFSQLQMGYYTGGDRILSQNPHDNSRSLTFYPRNVYSTEKDGVFAIHGNLVLLSQNNFYSVGNASHADSYYPGHVHRFHTNAVSLKLHGFWSEYSGKLCMVGGGSAYTKQGQFLNFEGVLKLSNFKNSSSVITLVTGTLDSLSSTDDLSYFEPISILILPRTDYEYTLVSKEFDEEYSRESEGVKSLPASSLLGGSFCIALSRAINELNLKYSSDCNSTNNFSPFGASIGYLPRIVSLKEIECLEKGKKMRVLVKFPNSSYVGGFHHSFNPDITLVGEGSWDNKTNQLRVVACRFLNTSGSLVNAQVGDCTTRLTLSFPAVRTIRETSDVVGKIWSNKAANDSGYFNSILFQSTDNPIVRRSSLKYEYTETTSARKLCLLNKKLEKKKGERYPTGHSDDMQFDLRVRTSTGNGSWGYATPLFIGDQFYRHNWYPNFVAQASLTNNSPINISYKIDITLQPGKILGSSGSYGRGQIFSEGIYDAERGRLCMVGCRNIVNDSMDCEILVNFQLPPLNPKKNQGYIKGSIKSTRVESDPLYFEPMDVSSVAYSTAVMRKSIVRMDWEVIMALISNTLVCAFVGLQIFHVKKNPHVLPFISLVMLLILTCHMIPLVLNIEALFRERQNGWVASDGWLEVNEVLGRIVTLVAFLLEFWLLQLSWSGRLANSNKTDLWFAEKWTLFVSLPLYAAGFVILFLSSYHSIWKDLKTYAGLILDGFLLPQILFNIFANSEQNALSCSFYIGTTFVRLLPHVYDLYRTRCYNLLGSYIYAIRNEDFYSTGWDITIPLAGLLFAAIIYLQQRFGGRGVIPGKLGEGEAYTKVPVVSES